MVDEPCYVSIGRQIRAPVDRQPPGRNSTDNNMSVTWVRLIAFVTEGRSGRSSRTWASLSSLRQSRRPENRPPTGPRLCKPTFDRAFFQPIDRRAARNRHPQPVTGSHASVRTAREKSGFEAELRRRENLALSVDRKPFATAKRGPHRARPAPAAAPRDPPHSADTRRSAIGPPILNPAFPVLLVSSGVVANYPSCPRTQPKTLKLSKSPVGNGRSFHSFQQMLEVSARESVWHVVVSHSSADPRSGGVTIW